MGGSVNRVAPIAVLALAALVLGLAACAGLPNTNDETAVDATATVFPGAEPMVGPVIGFYLEDSYQEVYLGLFDTGSGAFRDLYGTVGITLDAARWDDGGCTLYIDGRLHDLRGNTIWSPDAAAGEFDPGGSRLAPDRGWLAVVSRSGEQTAAGLEQIEVETIRLSAPFDHVRLTSRGGGHPAALVWSADGQRLYYTDYDERGLLQVYSARPDGGEARPVTAHDAPVGHINALALSPDGHRLAYGARNLSNPGRPYAFDPADEGWIGIVDLGDGSARRVALSMFDAAEPGRGLVWDDAGERLLVIGDSLPVAHDDPLYGRQIHWLTAGGEIERSFYQADAPSEQVGWISPLDDIDTLMFSSNADYYRYENGELRRLEGAAIPPLGLEMGRRPIGVLPAVVGFEGEQACGSEP